MWVPFNEGWGQFDSEKAVETILQLDTTRTIDHASGWHDQGVGDSRSNVGFSILSMVLHNS